MLLRGALPVPSPCTPQCLCCVVYSPLCCPLSSDPPTLQQLATPATQPHRRPGDGRLCHQTSRTQDSTRFAKVVEKHLVLNSGIKGKSQTLLPFYTSTWGYNCPANHRLCDLEVSEESEMVNSLRVTSRGAVTGTWDQRGWQWRVLKESAKLRRRWTGGPLPHALAHTY